ncbi:hypothetical protein K435DRAFT_796328 [Dendrothele bispora CBS 962.96]|uniref:Uncharacterized protein n=1 Tax=Dendrothele bispora (strain CBS 962.96) TaxID=1314807 RepID=A0A4S8M743_DENBC|nr:hypothetical protein K435DRAFT_796328 [Dendrothele bispora CBS 962.96]
MGDAAGDAGAACCGLCCVGLFGALSSFCSTKAFGTMGCGGSSGQGCCGSCCKESFDADNFDEVVKKDMEKTRAKESSRGSQGSQGPLEEGRGQGQEQPKPTPNMSATGV